MRRIAITGSSGYLGDRFIRHVRIRNPAARVLGVDVRPPEGEPPDEFHCGDVADVALREILRAFEPDTIVHAAFAFAPSRDDSEMRRVNIGGGQNVLAAAAELQPARCMVVTSATAYGAWPDNPIPMNETWPLRPREDFRYSADKSTMSRLVAEFATEHPEIAVSEVRPAIIGGPHMNNYLSRFIFGMPFLARMDGYDTPLQFVHERDVAEAMGAILAASSRGVFNIGPPSWTTITEIARATNRRVLSLPYWLVRVTHELAWRLRLPIHESPASFLSFARYPWVVDSSRLRDELGFEFQYSSADTLREIIARDRPAAS